MMESDFSVLLEKKEDLDFELQSYLSTKGGLTGIYHPLLYFIFHTPELNALVNAQFKAKKDAVSKAWQEQRWASYIFLHERPYRLNAFYEISVHLSNQDYWKLLGDIYTDSENIWQNLDTWKELMRSQRTESQLFMSPADQEYLTKLPNEFVIYRGYVQGQNKKGLSFTLSEEKAKWFAERFHSKKAKVSERIVLKEQVFAYKSSRNEEEIIIKPKFI